MQLQKGTTNNHLKRISATQGGIKLIVFLSLGWLISFVQHLRQLVDLMTTTCTHSEIYLYPRMLFLTVTSYVHYGCQGVVWFHIIYAWFLLPHVVFTLVNTLLDAARVYSSWKHDKCWTKTPFINYTTHCRTW